MPAVPAIPPRYGCWAKGRLIAARYSLLLCLRDA
jgi:hypothetical protein